eukprot:TRINITY_DN2564_c0_g1_i1.p1 TRINITY_DN2564_c0_g1~~TRINITY_DN2564_c0_g1_i1.p1  ORF type:complete len:126 (+),score=28.08 TRINITY_DN2564_c0_g1_i1:82-459(+)
MGNISGGDAATHLAQDIGKVALNIPTVKLIEEGLAWSGEWAEVVGENGLPQLNAPGPVTPENKEAMELVVAILKSPNRITIEVPESCIETIKEVFANYGQIKDGKLVLNEPPPPVMEAVEEHAEQ